MSGIELGLIWLGWVLAGGSPGPATLGISGTAMNKGRVQALAFACGILAGSAFWGVAAAVGLGALMLANAWAFWALKYIGAAYLLFLAFKSLKSAFSNRPLKDGSVARGTLRAAFVKGALIHLTNPKAILSWGAIYSIALPVEAPASQIATLFVFLFSGSILVFIGYAFLFSTPRAVRIYRAARRWFELGFAGLFGLASLKILTVQLR